MGGGSVRDRLPHQLLVIGLHRKFHGYGKNFPLKRAVELCHPAAPPMAWVGHTMGEVPLLIRMSGKDCVSRVEADVEFLATVTRGSAVSQRLTQKLQQFPGAEPRGGIGAFKQPVGEIALVVVQFDDLLLDGALGDEAVDRYRARLPDSVGAVGGLVFDGRDSTRGPCG